LRVPLQPTTDNSKPNIPRTAPSRFTVSMIHRFADLSSFIAKWWQQL